MAIQEKSGLLRGKAGSVVFRKWRGLNIVQGKPRPFKQSVATRAAAAEFGLASSTSADIRKSLALFYQQADLGMPNRLTGKVLRCIQQCPDKDRLDRDIHDGDLSALLGFEFNENSPLADCLPVQPVVQMDETGHASITLPAFQLKDIRYAAEASFFSGYRLRIVAIAYNFRDFSAEILDVQDITLNEHNEAIHWNLKEVAPAGSILLLGMALYREQRVGEQVLLLNSRAWSPAAIVGIGHIKEAATPIVEQNSEPTEEEQPIRGSKTLQLTHSLSRIDKEWLRKEYRGYLERKQHSRPAFRAPIDMKKGKIVLRA